MLEVRYRRRNTTTSLRFLPTSQMALELCPKDYSPLGDLPMQMSGHQPDIQEVLFGFHATTSMVKQILYTPMRYGLYLKSILTWCSEMTTSHYQTSLLNCDA